MAGLNGGRGPEGGRESEGGRGSYGREESKLLSDVFQGNNMNYGQLFGSAGADLRKAKDTLKVVEDTLIEAEDTPDNKVKLWMAKAKLFMAKVKYLYYACWLCNSYKNGENTVSMLWVNSKDHVNNVLNNLWLNIQGVKPEGFIMIFNAFSALLDEYGINIKEIDINNVGYRNRLSFFNLLQWSIDKIRNGKFTDLAIKANDFKNLATKTNRWEDAAIREDKADKLKKQAEEINKGKLTPVLEILNELIKESGFKTKE